jgi:hypothetical protein
MRIGYHVIIQKKKIKRQMNGAHSKHKFFNKSEDISIKNGIDYSEKSKNQERFTDSPDRGFRDQIRISPNFPRCEYVEIE